MRDPFHTSIDGDVLARKRDRIERERAETAEEYAAAADVLEDDETSEHAKAVRLLREEAARWRQ